MKGTFLAYKCREMSSFFLMFLEEKYKQDKYELCPQLKGKNELLDK